MSADSLVSSQVYEIIKTIYDTTSDATPNPIATESIDSAPRIKVLQSTLGQLRLNNIATLDAITNHFTRLIDLTSADDEYVAALAQTLAPCILRPRMVNALTMEERHPYRLIRDLFDHKESIFGELKRQASSSGSAPSASASQRSRAVSSTDESSRRAAMEARARAINSERQRAKSPAPTNRHRRDKSTDGGAAAGNAKPLRFPVVASPRPESGRIPSVQVAKRGSLEVPGSAGSSPVATRENVSMYSAVTTTPPRADTMSSMTADALSPDSIDQPHNGDRDIKRDSTPTPTEAIPDGAMPGAFGSSGPHIAPPMDDENESSSAPSTTFPTRTSSTTAPEGSLETKSSIGSLKRQMGGTGSGGRRQGPSGRYGSLKARSGLNLTGAPEGPADSGVQLSDRAMDEDFS